MSLISRLQFKIRKAIVLVLVIIAVQFLFVTLWATRSCQPITQNNPSEYTIRIPQLFILDDLYTNRMVA